MILYITFRRDCRLESLSACDLRWVSITWLELIESFILLLPLLLMIEDENDSTFLGWNLVEDNPVVLIGWFSFFRLSDISGAGCLLFVILNSFFGSALIVMFFIVFSWLLVITEAARPGEASVLTQFFFKLRARCVDLPTTLKPLI